MTKKEVDKMYKKLRQKYTNEEIAEAYLFPITRPRKEKEKLDKEFGEFLTKLRENRTPEEKLHAKMLQLKYQMQDYVGSKRYDEGKRFGYFLSRYIEMLEKKNKDFAEDINITAIELSQLINNHRNPNIKILIRLEIHSDNAIPAYIWYKVVEKEKAHEIVNNKEIRKQEQKYVRNVVKLAS